VQLLLDTHALIWWLSGDAALSAVAKAAIADPANEVFISAASAWEISTKYRLGKLQIAAPFITNLAYVIQNFGFKLLPIEFRHAESAGALPGSHKDPFDRMLIAQALLENLTLVSNEQLFDSYGVNRLW
jgi:PIN domain nuclease of toxin-antitoxin system